MLNMDQRLLEEVAHVLVLQRIEDMLPVLACAYDVEQAQQLEVMGDRRLAHAQRQAEIAHADFGRGQQADDAYACGIRQRLEELCHARGGDAIDKMIRDEAGMGHISV